MRVVWIILPLLLAFGLAGKRGLAVGLFAALVYGLVGIGCAFNARRMAMWSRTHPVLDSAFIIPFAFLALAYLTNVALVLCGVYCVGLGALSMALSAVFRRRRFRAS
jgi:hypothetical protein